MRFNIVKMVVLLVFLLFFGGCSVSKKNKNDAMVHYALGVAYLREPSISLALKEFLLAEKYNPGHADIQAALAQTYQQKKAYAEAERHYLKALQLDHNNPSYLNNLAVLYLETGRWNDAIRTFRQAAADLLFETPEIPLAGICHAYIQKGEYLSAVVACQDAISRNPRYAVAHQRLGEAYFALDKNDLAIRAFQQAVTLVPGYVDAHYRLGLAYLKVRRNELASASFRKVITLAPDSEQGRQSREYLSLIK
ncbi:MAG: hypothetical protein A2091_09675 [Desulfuromonadales bacterium GWD2_61_12]|nr:MAG: hypothetical protein A2005_03745 [Desulfuromonadales bacterium GWC2_61_20]OGR35073.1 MAG: hypothetical protein A2091_09675 [Desulfuromonadales bacterium GWD2_61_12]HAD03620.1 hypothetical protein [Desulfuromonas sp.]